jgi:hypothetical protein
MFYRIMFRRGQSAKAKEYQGQAGAVTTAPIRRYKCGMTVGHGWYRHFTHEDAAGAACGVLGWFDDGRVNVALPVGGCGLLGRADVEIVSWPDSVPAERRAEWDALPRVSRLTDGEMA